MALTAKQKLFCENYVSNGYKLQKAYMDAYPDASPETANVEQWKLMKREPINAYIRELQHARFEALHISADKIAEELNRIAFYDKDASNSDKMRALDLLQKQMGLQTQRVEADVKTTIIDINIEEPDGE